MMISKFDEKQINFKGVVKYRFNEDLDLMKSQLASFLCDVHTDYRYLGIIIMEAYTRCTIDYQEKQVMLRPNYTFDDLTHFFEISRASKGIRKLLQLCFAKLPPDPNELISLVENPDHYCFESKNTLQAVDEVIGLLETELASFGGVGAPDMTPTPSFLTDEDREQLQLKKAERQAELATKAIEGRYSAAERVEVHNKQVWLCAPVVSVAIADMILLLQWIDYFFSVHTCSTLTCI